MANDIFNLAFVDAYTGKGFGSAGGVVQVCAAGTAHKLGGLLDPLNNFVALANPVPIIGGAATFAIPTGGPGQASPLVCDVYGITGSGHSFSRLGIRPGDPTEVVIDSNRREEVLILPWAVADCTPGTEKDTGFTLPNGTVVAGPPFMRVTVAAGQAAKTLSVGLLSTQGGGSATGFLNGLSLTALGIFKGTINGAAATLGPLLTVVQGAAGAPTSEGALVNNTTALATAANISYTITAAATLAEGFFTISYQLNSPPPNQP